MRVKSALFSLALTAILGAGPASALEVSGRGSFAPAPSVPLPVAEKAAERPVLLAQSFDPRVTQLEEEIRKLNGRIEEMNFQILQMQESLRKAQEDNEFRIQQLEQQQGGEKQGALEQPVKAAEAAPTTDVPQQTADTQPATADPATTTAEAQPSVDWQTAGKTDPKLGQPPRNLGALKVDEGGKVTGETKEENTDGTTVAALPAGGDAGDLYRTSYQYILSGDYSAAESGFRQYADTYPDASDIADAKFWLGESLFGQEKYRDAAQVFLDASKAHPKAKKAPDMLLKLGISLAAMKQTDIACATYKAIPSRYPNLSAALKERVKQEQALAGC